MANKRPSNTPLVGFDGVLPRSMQDKYFYAALSQYEYLELKQLKIRYASVRRELDYRVKQDKGMSKNTRLYKVTAPLCRTAIHKARMQLMAIVTLIEIAKEKQRLPVDESGVISERRFVLQRLTHDLNVAKNALRLIEHRASKHRLRVANWRIKKLNAFRLSVLNNTLTPIALAEYQLLFNDYSDVQHNAVIYFPCTEDDRPIVDDQHTIVSELLFATEDVLKVCQCQRKIFLIAEFMAKLRTKPNRLKQADLDKLVAEFPALARLKLKILVKPASDDNVENLARVCSQQAILCASLASYISRLTQLMESCEITGYSKVTADVAIPVLETLQRVLDGITNRDLLQEEVDALKAVKILGDRFTTLALMPDYLAEREDKLHRHRCRR